MSPWRVGWLPCIEQQQLMTVPFGGWRPASVSTQRLVPLRGCFAKPCVSCGCGAVVEVGLTRTPRPLMPPTLPRRRQFLSLLASCTLPLQRARDPAVERDPAVVVEAGATMMMAMVMMMLEMEKWIISQQLAPAVVLALLPCLLLARMFDGDSLRKRQRAWIRCCTFSCCSHRMKILCLCGLGAVGTAGVLEPRRQRPAAAAARSGQWARHGCLMLPTWPECD